MARQVFIDQDGVLADFIGGICQAHGKDDPYQHPHSKGVWDVWELFDMSVEEFWRPCEFGFWRGLPKTPEADQIHTMACIAAYANASLKNCHVQARVITSPSQNDGCITGKLEWLDNHFPHLSHEVIFERDKWKYAKVSPGSLLIDDNAANCDKWEAAGGVAVLVPRLWNRAWEQADNVVEVVRAGVVAWIREGN